MDVDQFKRFMLAFQTQLQRQVLQRKSQVRIQRQLIRRCFSLLKISILKMNPSSTIANDLKTFLK
jgi:hypothetical protein